MRLPNWLLPLTIAAVAMTARPIPTHAHAVETNYEIDLLTKELQLTSTYSTGEAMQYAEVEIYAPNQPDRIWATGKTDAKGRFSFKPAPALTGDWQVVIKQDGHADMLTVPVDSRGIRLEKISFGQKLDIHYPTGLLTGRLWTGTAPKGEPYRLGVEWDYHSQKLQLVVFVKINQFSVGIAIDWKSA